MIIDNAVYVDGHRIARPEALADTYRLMRKNSGMAWIGLYRPTDAELKSLRSEFDLHELAIEDIQEARQRPKLERYGDTLFVVLRAAHYLDAVEEVHFSEVHVVAGPDFVLTVRHGEAPDLGGVRRRLEMESSLLKLGPEAVLYAIVDRIVDDYVPVVAGLEHDIEEIEAQVFTNAPRVSQRIYELSREVVEFQKATRPLAGVLVALAAGFDKYGTDEELRRYLRDVQDHLTRVIERIDGFRQLLQAMLSVNATLVAQQQNEEMRKLTEASLAQSEEVKKISAWAAILFAPTLIGTVYGMNFEFMPERDWLLGYPFAITLMLGISFTLYIMFRRRDWL